MQPRPPGPRIRFTDSGEPARLAWQRRPDPDSAYAVFQPTVPFDPEKATFIVLPRMDTTVLLEKEVDQVRRAWGSDNLVVLANCDEQPYWWNEKSQGGEFDLLRTPPIRQILNTIERLDREGFKDLYLIAQSQSGGLIAATLGFSLYEILQAYNKHYDPECAEEKLAELVRHHRVLGTLGKVKGLVILNGVPAIRDGRFPLPILANIVLKRLPFSGLVLWGATLRIPDRAATPEAKRAKRRAYVARLEILRAIERNFDRISEEFDRAVALAFARNQHLPAQLRNAFPMDVRLIYHVKDHVARASAADRMWYGFWLSLVGNRHTAYHARTRQFHTSIQTRDFVGWLRDYMVLMHARGRR